MGGLKVENVDETKMDKQENVEKNHKKSRHHPPQLSPGDTETELSTPVTSDLI